MGKFIVVVMISLVSQTCYSQSIKITSPSKYDLWTHGNDLLISWEYESISDSTIIKIEYLYYSYENSKDIQGTLIQGTLIDSALIKEKNIVTKFPNNIEILETKDFRIKISIIKDTTNESKIIEDVIKNIFFVNYLNQEHDNVKESTENIFDFQLNRESFQRESNYLKKKEILDNQLFQSKISPEIYSSELNNLVIERNNKTESKKIISNKEKILFINDSYAQINWVPVKNESEAEMFYDVNLNNDIVRLIEKASLNTNFNGNYSINSEILTGYLGAVKLGLFFNVSNDKSSQIDTSNTALIDSINLQQNAIQRITNNGNFAVDVKFPLLLIKLGKLKSFFLVKSAFSGDIQSKDINENNFAHMFYINPSFIAQLNINEDFKITGETRYSYLVMSNKLRENLAIGSEIPVANDISIFNISLGAILWKKIKIEFILYPGGSKIVDEKFKNQFSVSFIR